jgi:hypothetical protein
MVAQFKLSAKLGQPIKKKKQKKEKKKKKKHKSKMYTGKLKYHFSILS